MLLFILHIWKKIPEMSPTANVTFSILQFLALINKQKNKKQHLIQFKGTHVFRLVTSVSWLSSVVLFWNSTVWHVSFTLDRISPLWFCHPLPFPSVFLTVGHCDWIQLQQCLKTQVTPKEETTLQKNLSLDKLFQYLQNDAVKAH